MADRALLAGYPRNIISSNQKCHALAWCYDYMQCGVMGVWPLCGHIYGIHWVATRWRIMTVWYILSGHLGLSGMTKAEQRVIPIINKEYLIVSVGHVKYWYQINKLIISLSQYVFYTLNQASTLKELPLETLTYGCPLIVPLYGRLWVLSCWQLMPIVSRANGHLGVGYV